MDENKFMLYFMGPLIAICLISIVVCSIVIHKAYQMESKMYQKKDPIERAK
jgi:hypothetical protein